MFFQTSPDVGLTFYNTPPSSSTDGSDNADIVKRKFGPRCLRAIYI